ncbi:MAG: metal-dependent hydrolase [Pseudobutyrivibrio sp.]|nr:metal-dependent hydrolase [Pseudobutyrivibrio sp.]
MLSMTHLAIGLASSITILGPKNIQELCPIVIGASVGSILCDIDCKIGTSKDAVLGRTVATIISVVALYTDIAAHGSMFEYFMRTHIISLVLGLLMILITGYFSRESVHRGFSHSLMAFGLYVIGMFFFSAPVLIGFIIGFASHLLLDLINYRPIQLFYPLEKGVSLKICKANSRLNIVIMILGYIWLIGVCILYYKHLLL